MRWQESAFLTSHATSLKHIKGKGITAARMSPLVTDSTEKYQKNSKHGNRKMWKMTGGFAMQTKSVYASIIRLGAKKCSLDGTKTCHVLDPEQIQDFHAILFFGGQWDWCIGPNRFTELGR